MSKKNNLIILFCISALVFVGHVFAQEGATRPKPEQIPSASGNIQSQPPPPVPQNVPANIQTGVPVNVAPQIPADIQQNIPSHVQPQVPANVTPEQIKAFMTRPKEENYIILNFDNADLRDVINTVGSITKENFIISPGVDARITIHSAKKIPVSEVMNVFESVLEANGVALVKSGEFFKVVPGATAKQKPVEIRKGGEAESISSIDRIVTQIVPVDYVPVSEITAVLTPLLSQFGSIIPNPRNNLLIINDSSSSIKRLLSILEEVDVNAFKNTRMLFFKPQYSDITTVTNELTEVLNALNMTKEGIALIPVERINSLIIFSSSPSLLEAVHGWLKKLDEEVVSGQNVFIYPVQNVKAEHIADILNSIYGEGGGGAKKISAQQTDPQKKAAQPQTQAQPQIQPVSHSGGKEGTGGRVEIIAFEPTNSLIILASPGIYREMIETIKKIDIFPREVLIEAIVAQVTLSNTDEYGIQWSVLHDVKVEGIKDITGVIRNNPVGTGSPSLITSIPTLASGAGFGGLSFILFKPDSFSALIRALASRGKVNILSSPRLLVRDQEEANIEVGSEIPTATSSTTPTDTSLTTITQSIQYKTVGIKLKIKPTINEERTVVLDLEQEVSSKGEDQSVGGLAYPSFNTTKAKTSIVVLDKQGIVIGGIMEESKSKKYQGIPLLSSIPILGNLFRYNVDDVTKKELVIIITPRVIVNKTEGEQLTADFMNKLKEVKKYLGEKEIIMPSADETSQSKPAATAPDESTKSPRDQ